MKPHIYIIYLLFVEVFNLSTASAQNELLRLDDNIKLELALIEKGLLSCKLTNNSDNPISTSAVGGTYSRIIIELPEPEQWPNRPTYFENKLEYYISKFKLIEITPGESKTWEFMIANLPLSSYRELYPNGMEVKISWKLLDRNSSITYKKEDNTLVYAQKYKVSDPITIKFK